MPRTLECQTHVAEPPLLIARVLVGVARELQFQRSGLAVERLGDVHVAVPPALVRRWPRFPVELRPPVFSAVRVCPVAPHQLAVDVHTVIFIITRARVPAAPRQRAPRRAAGYGECLLHVAHLVAPHAVDVGAASLGRLGVAPSGTGRAAGFARLRGAQHPMRELARATGDAWRVP